MEFDIKVSVVVIAKNAENTIAKCLSSVIKQTYRPYEIIVVDGRSTDKTRDVASRFPVKIIEAPLRDTYGTSRNLGVKKAKGNVVAFLDADDYAEKTWLENILKAFSRTDAGVINPSRIYFYPNNWFTDLKWKKMRKKRRLEGRPHIAEESWRSFGITGSAFRKEFIEKVGYFDEDMFFGTEDKDIALRILRM